MPARLYIHTGRWTTSTSAAITIRTRFSCPASTPGTTRIQAGTTAIGPDATTPPATTTTATPGTAIAIFTATTGRGPTFFHPRQNRWSAARRAPFRARPTSISACALPTPRRALTASWCLPLRRPCRPPAGPRPRDAAPLGSAPGFHREACLFQVPGGQPETWTAAVGPAAGRAATSLANDRLQRSEEHTSELQSRGQLVCRLLLEEKKKKQKS